MSCNLLILCLTLTVATVHLCQGFENIENVLRNAIKNLNDLKGGDDTDRPVLFADEPVAVYGNLSNDISKLGFPPKVMVYEFDKFTYNTYDNMLHQLSTGFFSTRNSELNVKRSDKFIKDIDDWEFSYAPQSLKIEIGNWVENLIGKDFTEKFHLDAKNNGFFLEFISKVLQSMDSNCKTFDTNLKIRGLVQIPIVVYPTLTDDNLRIYKITIDGWVGCQLLSNEGGLNGDFQAAVFRPRMDVIKALAEPMREKITKLLGEKYPSL